MNIIKKIKYKIGKKLGMKNDTSETLRAQGLKIGNNVDIINSLVDYYVEIGDNVTITNATILSHDASTKKFIGKTKFGKVIIGNNVFIGLGAIVLPGSIIGDNVIIGAGAVVSGTVEDNSVMVGNPAKKICSTDEYLAKHKNNMNDNNTFDTPINRNKKQMDEVRQKLQEGVIYYDN